VRAGYIAVTLVKDISVVCSIPFLQTEQKNKAQERPLALPRAITD